MSRKRGIIRPSADFSWISLVGTLSEKTPRCPWLSAPAHAYLPSLLGCCLVRASESGEALLELAQHLLQLAELAGAKAPRDLGIDGLGRRRDGGHQFHALFRDRDHAAPLIGLGGLPLDQVPC